MKLRATVKDFRFWRDTEVFGCAPPETDVRLFGASPCPRGP